MSAVDYYEEENEYEEEIKRLETKLSKEEERTAECQREIARLRAVAREYDALIVAMTKPNYENLFEAWGNFDDEESPAEVKAICERIGQMDGVSFRGFCAGYMIAAYYGENVKNKKEW